MVDISPPEAVHASHHASNVPQPTYAEESHVPIPWSRGEHWFRRRLVLAGRPCCLPGSGCSQHGIDGSREIGGWRADGGCDRLGQSPGQEHRDVGVDQPAGTIRLSTARRRSVPDLGASCWFRGGSSRSGDFVRDRDRAGLHAQGGPGLHDAAVRRRMDGEPAGRDAGRSPYEDDLPEQLQHLPSTRLGAQPATRRRRLGDHREPYGQSQRVAGPAREARRGEIPRPAIE